ncbi:phage late control D family protein [Terracoccus sp. 273MFTsu3.1]|uniref:phage late control D family protein n=1 Tax=Terracoccus sp. 273MFTsu3.1 TaxID=1172188 RepID=UPI00036E6847|nr:contractile injection system protein, VgrG/Pvc8 family [Terracoccus sp. 273MFTsu3.1]
MTTERSVSVYFNGVRSTSPVVRYETHAAFGKHSVNVLDLRTGSARIAFPEWTPVVVDLRVGATMDRWYGYVHHYGEVDDTRASDVSNQNTRYTLIGTSLPLNEQRTRSWKNMTRSGVVREVARAHKFRTMVQRDGEILPFIAQAGNSDMALLQQMADESGYRLWVDGSTLRFIDPDTLLTGVRTLDIRSFNKGGGPGTPDGIISWSTKAGSMVPRATGSAGAQSVYGLDRRTGTVVGAAVDQTPSGLPSLTKIDTNSVVTGTGQAVSRASANSKKARAWVTAKAIVVCSPGVKPGDVIEVAGDRIKPYERGLWLVTGVSHRVLNDGSAAGFEYLTTLDLERDGIYSPSFNAAFRTINTRDLVAARIRDGYRWEAEVMEDVRVG